MTRRPSSNQAGQIALKGLFGFLIILLVGVFFIGILPGLAAWSEPSAPPPGGNPDFPVNIGSTYQTKTGSLNIEGNSGANVGLIVGKGDLVVGGGKNVIYGNAKSTSTGTLLKLENCSGTGANICEGAVTALSVDISGNVATRGTIGISQGASPEKFLVTAAGDITRINNVDYTWPASQASGTKCLTNDGAGALTWGSCGTGGSATPGGSNTQIQFNDSDSFGGAIGMTYNKTTQILTLTPTAGAGANESPLFVNTSAAAVGGFASFQKNGTEKAEFGWGDLCGGGDANGAAICAANRIVQFGGQGHTDMTITGGKVGIGTTSPNYKLTVLGGDNYAIFGESNEYGVYGKTNSADYAGVFGYTDVANGKAILSQAANGGWAGYFLGDGFFSTKLGIGEESPGYELDIKNSAATGTAMVRLNQNNATKLYTGVRMDRQSTEKWYVGMDNSTDNFLIRRTGSINDIYVDANGDTTINGDLTVNGELTTINNSLTPCVVVSSTPESPLASCPAGHVVTGVSLDSGGGGGLEMTVSITCCPL
ncbi:MAG: hypothetical protein PHV78_00500 [Patescibacteria group bacterium]|nr:hypothetical protein [Patescibacteria group bacterium]MDD5121348.1 hypothetical protein [Patescibacteria group bacterium]MDD5395733.1 hypothetical protein [Patescibacteria group bacterium]